MKNGFTVAELLIVIAIIVILASIAIPSFMRARELSEKKRVEADQKISLEKDDGSTPKIVPLTEQQAYDNYEKIVRRREREKRQREFEEKTREFDEKVNRSIEKKNLEDAIKNNDVTAKEGERIRHEVERMFEVDGVVFYSAIAKNNLFLFAINKNGIVTIAK